MSRNDRYNRNNERGGSRYEDNRRRYETEQYMYEDRRRRKKGSALGTFILTLLLLLALAVFAFAAWKLYGYYRDYKAGTDEYNALRSQYTIDVNKAEAQTETSETPQGEKPEVPGVVLTDVTQLEDPATVETKKEAAAKETTTENNETKQLPLLKNPIDFAQLRAINEDIIGWIRIGALSVSYPVAQAADNDFYLHRTFERQDNFAGCIFLNCDNSPFFTDQNSVVYGHNMKNGSMFGTLKKFREQETYDANPYFWIFTPNLIYQYRIFCTAEVATVGDPYRIRFTSDEFKSFLQTMSSSSLVRTGVTPGEKDRIVTLSTCTGNDATRFIVQGVLEQVYIAK